MVNDKKKQLAYNIVEFLRTSSADGTVKEDDKESLEVAISCIAESFGIDPESSSDKAQYSIAPANLVSLLDVYLQTKAKTSSNTSSSTSAAPTSSSASTSTSTPTPTPKTSGPSAEDKARANALKAEGNALMSSKSYPAAIDAYTRAIEIYADPVYFSNRAAAYGAQGAHESAAEDAQRAIDLDPAFTKAYSRLGHALFSSGDVKGSVQAYERGLEREPGNTNMQQALNVAKAKLKEQEPVARSEGAAAGAGAGGMPDLSALAGLMGGGGAGGGGGGMPDLASLMQNPQMMQMAQQMMGNGGLERMMQNPNIRRMAEQFQSGGGMPDMASLAQDPEMRNLAQQFMGGRQP